MYRDAMSGDHVEAASLSAVTLIVSDMARSVDFYRSLGFDLRYGGAGSDFTSFTVGEGYLNLALGAPPSDLSWGRFIVYVADVDAHHRKVQELGLKPEAPPRDAEWGERYFHVRDPDGHEVSFAKLLDR
jgi:catechol 2,3-dioxygenase-like lactoylglutathione lyase family enzyme